jgi:hypothetical protein
MVLENRTEGHWGTAQPHQRDPSLGLASLKKAPELRLYQ